MTKWYLVSLSIVCAATVGCGGGGGASNSTPSSQTTIVGTARVSFAGSPQLVSGGKVNGVSVAGLSGASISLLVDYPARVLGNTQIAFTQTGTGGSIFLKLFDCGDQTVSNVTNLGQSGGNLSRGINCTFTHDGHICFEEWPNGSFTPQIAECNLDGSSITQLSHTSTSVQYGFDVSPNNQYLVYTDGEQLYRSNFNGTGEVVLASAIFLLQYPSISPDGTTVAYQGTLSAGGIAQIFTIPIAGGAPTQLTHLSSNNAYYPRWTPDGKWIVYTQLPTGSSLNQLNFYRVADGLVYSVLQPSANPARATLSPDGNQLVFDSTPASGGNSYLQVADVGGANVSTIVPQDPAVSDIFPIWSPFLVQKIFVGSAGELMAAAAGFLESQNMSAFRGLLAFGATTPSTATITQAGGSGGSGSLVYDLHADTITALKYVSGYYLSAVQVPTSNASDIFVSIDGQTGRIDSVAPALARGAKPMTARSGSGTVISGHFSAVYDGKGKNLAPNGASNYILDSNGKVISVQPQSLHTPSRKSTAARSALPEHE